MTILHASIALLERMQPWDQRRVLHVTPELGTTTNHH